MTMDDFLVRALLGGIGVALVAGPLGAFVVWRRMAYFGAAMAHAALLGVALGLLLEVDLTLAIIAVCVLLAVVVVGLEKQKALASDTLLGILAHGTLACGLVAIAFQKTVRVDLLAYLFGDILAVSRGDLAWIFAGGGLVLAVLVAIWRPLLAATVHEELAQVEGVAVGRVRLVFMVLLAVAIAVGLKVAGLLLIAALLIIPAAAARRLAATPEQMALGAIAIGCLSVVGGLYGSLTWDAPAGPSIVVAATLLFAMTSLVRKRG
jgi:zinc transport system permease protein